ncbi:unnamed protein product [Paramecium octaurelia]|uniref:EGF-like domain-containing protein n=1 Tax=Paramecium octaurelia TaxID=43137 RepID=A0A8S1UHX9_PAROT|nr:unnamed protein product [Paramecium octaurelia]
MLKSIFEILSLLLYIQQSIALLYRNTNSQCTFMPYGPLLYPTNPQIQLDLNVPEDVVQYQENIGYGVWTKYQPFGLMSDLSIITLQYFRKQGMVTRWIYKQIKYDLRRIVYIFNETKGEQYQILVVSLLVDQIDQRFQHSIYYSFAKSSGLIQFNTYTIIEGIWILCYAYFDFLTKITTIGIYNNHEPLKTYQILDTPSFVSQIRHNVGGIYSYKNKNGDRVQLTQFIGSMSNLFTSNNQNILLDLEQCVNQFIKYDICYSKEYNMSQKIQYMSGFDLIQMQTSVLNIPIYQIQGWIKLDVPNLPFLETTIFRITINYNYSDDSYIGDREVLLKYFQSSVPGENGFKISTYSYAFPVKSRYKTQEDDKISEYGDQYSSMFITWHYFSFEIGTLNNDGQPQFTLYFPSENQYYKYIWDKIIKHFSGATYYIFIGGDNYVKSYLRGYVSDIKFYLYCQPEVPVVVVSCDYSCLDCDGPTPLNCLSCHENSHRQFSRTGKTCNCQEGFVDVKDQEECVSVAEAFSYLTKQEIELNCNLEGYSRCDGSNVECSFGYFLFQNQCVKCPEQSLTYDDIFLSCFDCYSSPITFGQSLKCTMDAKTFYFNSKYSYEIVQRDDNLVTFYEMKLNLNQTYIAKLCCGCMTIEQCKPGYYFMGGQCFPCIQNCYFCLNSYTCESCQEGHYLGRENQCIKCPNCKRCFLYEEFLWCSYCEDDQVLQNNECVQCGQNCNSCDQQGYCKFCNGDPSKYYLTIDGKNCKECNIENCVYCFEYVIISGQYSTTLEMNFNIYNFSTNQITTACALCKPNYHFNQNTNKCELKQIDDDCEFALILASTYQKVCIISLKNNDAVQVNSCSSLKYCKQCIHQYSANESYCIQCEDGYYSGVLTGQCQLCTNNCKTCLQQNSIFKDYWKWSVKAFYKQLINFNSDNSFEDQGQSRAQSDLEIICTSCQLQYILYQQQCIKGCEQSCIECKILDGKATCIQCQETDQGFLKSRNNNGECLQCPSYCIACIERNQQEISEINPYYIQNDENAQYSRKCYEKSKKQDNYYYDFLTQTITVCTNNIPCYNRFIIQQNVFCDSNQFNQLLNDNKDDQFKQKNILLSDFYYSDYLNHFESQLLYKYLNEAQVRNMEFQFTLIQGTQLECILEEDLTIYSLLQQNIFTLQQVDIIFEGQTSPTILTIFNEITLSNYTKVTFKNIKFNFDKILSSRDSFFITLFNLRLQLILSFQNCIFTMPYNTYRNYSLQIRSNIPYSLELQNFTITNFYVSQSEIFTFISLEQTPKNSVQITNFQIKNSFFFNSTLIKFQANHNNLPYDSQLNLISITDTIFFSSKFITSQGLLNYTTGSLLIKQIQFSNVQFYQNSAFLLSSSLSSLYIIYLTLDNTKICQNSNFFSSNIINLKVGTINNTQIKNSSLINNLVEYSKSEIALQSSSIGKIENYHILNTQYDDKQQIIKIIKYNEIVQLHLSLTDFSFMNGQLSTLIQQQEISYYSSIIYFECQLCYLGGIKLQRGHGLPEMTLLYSEVLDIKNFSISSNQIYITKSLHSSYECIEKFAFKNMHFFLYIGFYSIVNINSLDVSDSLSINSPFVILQGYDLMQRQSSEVITVFDVIFSQNLLLITDSNKQQLCCQQFLNKIAQQLFKSQTILEIILMNIFRTKQEFLLLQHSSNYIRGMSLYQIHTSFKILSPIQAILFYILNLLKLYYFNANLPIAIIQCIIHQVAICCILNFRTYNLLIFWVFSQQSPQVEMVCSLHNLYYLIRQLQINPMLQPGGLFIQLLKGKAKSLSDSNTFSSGGCLFVDGSVSQLKVIIKNTKFQESFSKYDGGAIYILPSKSYNWIELENLIVLDCFSLQNSFFSYNPPNIESLYTEILLKNINFKSTEQGFNKFIQSMNRLTEDEAFQVSYSNPQIFIHYGFISIINCSFISSHFQYLIQIKSAYHINLQNITIQNSTFLQSPMIVINLKEQLSGKILIENLQILNVVEFNKSIEGECQDIELPTSSQLQCPLSLPQKPWAIQSMDNIKTNQKLLICNLLSIFKNKAINLSLITINSLDSNHKLILKNINIQNVNCQNCLQGVFQIFDIKQQIQDQIIFSQIKFKNCVCGYKGCLSILQNSTNLNFNNDLFTNNRILQQNNLESIEFQLNHQVIVQNAIFLNNSARQGGSLFIQEINILIKNSLFCNNSAEIGGAIFYFSEQTSLDLFKTQFINNTAQIAGAVYFNNQSLQLTKELEIEFIDNNSSQYGDNIFEKPRSLSISIDGVKNTSHEIIEQIIVTPYKILGYSSSVNYLTLPSGRSISSYEYFDQYTSSFIPYNLTFRIIALDKFNNQNKGLYDSSCTLKPITFNITSQTEVSGITFSLSKYHVFFNNSTGDFNLDDLIIYWNPNYEMELVLRISIRCNQVSVPFYDKDSPYLIQSQNTNYNLLVDVRTFQCQLGEFLNQTTGGCILCDKFQNQYQVARKALNCSFKDDMKIRLIESSMIELRPTYWRAYNHSQNIEYCYHMPKNCQGGWIPGDKSCQVGHIGALCEQCDLYDSRGQGSFYLSSAYQCLNCKITVYNILSIIFVIFWTLLSTLISVSSTSEMIQEFIAGLRLRLFGVKFPIKQISSAILIKVFTNYLQIISTLLKFQLQLPNELTSIISSCANPIESMAFSLDCYLVQFTEVLIIYIRIIWSIIMALSYVILFIGLGGIAIAVKLIKHNFSFYTISVIYLFIFFQPSLIGQLISLLSYRQISDEFWISSNVAYRYDTSSHLRWIIAFDIPLLTILCITIPTILWYGVYKNRRTLDKTITRKTWGYLYQDETVKIVQKELIILVRIYYDDFITIKASLIFLILFFYSHFAKSINPYMTKQLNVLDQQSIIICAISIVLACSIYSAQQQNLQEIIWPFYVIIGCLNSFYTIKLVISIILAYFKRIFDKIDNLKQRIFAILPLKISSNPKIQRLLETRQTKLTRIQRRFQILKEYLLAISKENLKVRKSKQEQFQQRDNSQQLHKMILQYSLKGNSKYSDHHRRQSQLQTFHNYSRISLKHEEEHDNQFWRMQTLRQESQIL